MLRIQDKSGGWGPSGGQPLDDFLKNRILHGRTSLYDRDPEHIEARVERTAQALGNLMALLVHKKVLMPQEVLEAVGIGDWEMEREELVITEEASDAKA